MSWRRSVIFNRNGDGESEKDPKNETKYVCKLHLIHMRKRF